MGVVEEIFREVFLKQMSCELWLDGEDKFIRQVSFQFQGEEIEAAKTYRWYSAESIPENHQHFLLLNG